MANGHKKAFAQRYGEVLIGIVCTLGSMLYFIQLPSQYPFAHKSEVAAVKTEVAAVKTEVRQNSAQAAVAARQATNATSTAVRATSTAVKAETLAEMVKNEDAARVKGQAETDRRVQQLRRDINQNAMDIAKIKRKLGIQ